MQLFGKATQMACLASAAESQADGLREGAWERPFAGLHAAARRRLIGLATDRRSVAFVAPALLGRFDQLAPCVPCAMREVSMRTKKPV